MESADVTDSMGSNSVDMAVKLTPGCIAAIKRGENIDRPVVQFLDYERIIHEYTTIDGFRAMIWDGVVSDFPVLFSTRLNYLITSLELQNYSVIRLDQVRCYEPRPGQYHKTIYVLDLTILMKGEVVGKIIDPPTIYEGFHRVHQIPSFLMEISGYEEIPTDDAARGNSADIAAKLNLTPGCIEAIIQGKNIKQPVVQLVNYQRVMCPYQDSYYIAITDGTFSSAVAMLSIQLNDLITNGELQRKSIIRIDCYTRIDTRSVIFKKIIRIWNLTVLVKGNEVEDAADSSNYNFAYPIPHSDTFYETSDSVNLATKLTPGCIAAIFLGESIKQPVVQLLSYSKTEKESYVLEIADGIRSCSLVVLKPQLNYWITSGHLQERDIIRLDKYSFVEPPMGKIKKLVVISQLSILEKGKDLKEIEITEQIPSTSTKASIFIPYSRETSYRVNLAAKLTPGCIKAIFRGENIAQPVVQLLDYRKTQAGYRLTISDGTFISTWVSLESKLEYLIVSGKLRRRDIIRLDEYRCSEHLVPPDKLRILILIFQLSILEKGENVKEIRITKQIPSTLTDVSIYIPDLDTFHERSDSVNLAAKLTPGCIEAIFRGENIEQPVVQLLDYRKTEKGSYFSLKISDGTLFCSWIVLKPQLNNLIIRGQLQKRDVIRLDQYRCVESPISTNKIEKWLVILQLSILEKGKDEIPSTSTSLNLQSHSRLY